MIRRGVGRYGEVCQDVEKRVLFLVPFLLLDHPPKLARVGMGVTAQRSDYQ